MAAAIDHPNVIPVYEAGEEDGRLYLVMRWVAGTDLHRLLRDDGRLEPVRAARDRRPGRRARSTPRTPPGSCTATSSRPTCCSAASTPTWPTSGSRASPAPTRLTTAGHFLGTVDYMAPEQFHPGPDDARADVYALGCVLFAALTGAPPFPRETVPATMLAHLHDAPPRASARRACRAGFDRVLARALAKAPEDRYPSAGDLGRAALAAAEGRSVTEAERSVARGAAAPRSRDAPAASGAAAGARAARRARRAGASRYRTRARGRAGCGVGSARGRARGARRSRSRSCPAARTRRRPASRSPRPRSSGWPTRSPPPTRDEDAARISRLLTSDAQRVTPDATARTAAPRSSPPTSASSRATARPASSSTSLQADGRPAGRATARYTATYDGATPTDRHDDLDRDPRAAAARGSR